MGVNKIVYGGETLVDLTQDTVAPTTLAMGATAHAANGEVIEGEMPTTTVLYTEQALTDAQKAQARENIGVVGTGKDGASVTVKSVSESTADGGSNVVTFSDGKTLTVKNGSKGSKGDTGADGAKGSRGFCTLKITTAPSSYTTTTGGFTPAYRVALSTVLTQSKAANVIIGDIVIYSYYTYLVGYVDSSYVYLGARTSIRGSTGAAGAAGKTAYAYAQDGGYTGTEAEFAEGLADVGVLPELLTEVSTTTRSINLNPGGYEYGYLKVDGTKASYSPANLSIRHVDYVPVQGGKSIMFWFDPSAWNNNNPGGLVITLIEYDSNQNYITGRADCKSYITTSKPTYELNESTRYIKIATTNWTSGAMASVPIEDIKIGIYYAENATSEYVEYETTVTETMIRGDKVSGTSSLAGKKIVFDGDSICMGYNANGGYPAIIARISGCNSVNEAVGGGRLCANSENHSVVNNLSSLPKDGDIYCFQGGINDFWANTPIGTYTRGDYTTAVNTNTIYGAMETIFRYALTNFTGKAICFVITHKIQNTMYTANTEGKTFWDYREAMINVCEKYSIPYYDAFAESGLNGWNTVQNNAFLTGNSAGTADGTHPNEEGYKRYYVPQLMALFHKITPIQ